MAEDSTEKRYYCQREDLEQLIKHIGSQGFKVINQKRHAPQSPEEISTITVTCIKPSVDDSFKFLGWDGYIDVHHGELLAVNGDKTEWIVKSFTSAKNPLKKSSTVIKGKMYCVRKTDAYRLPCAIRTVDKIPDGFEDATK